MPRFKTQKKPRIQPFSLNADEIQAITTLYPQGKKAELIAALPHRKWPNIRQHARNLGVSFGSAIASVPPADPSPRDARAHAQHLKMQQQYCAHPQAAPNAEASRVLERFHAFMRAICPIIIQRQQEERT